MGRTASRINVPKRGDLGLCSPGDLHLARPVGNRPYGAPLFAPAETPKPVLDALYAIVAKAVASPEVQEKFKKQNYNIVPSKSVADAQEWLAGQMKHWETVTSAVKIEVQ